MHDDDDDNGVLTLAQFLKSTPGVPKRLRKHPDGRIKEYKIIRAPQ